MTPVVHSTWVRAGPPTRKGGSCRERVLRGTMDEARRGALLIGERG